MSIPLTHSILTLLPRTLAGGAPSCRENTASPHEMDSHPRRKCAASRRTLLRWAVSMALSLLAPVSIAVAYPVFDGAGEYGTDALGYYYSVTGGLFPTGTTPNGDNASGGTFRFLTDDPAWGYGIDVWHKDDWYPNNASIALTLENGSTTVYDNNGLETGTFPTGYYDYGAGFPVPGAGAVTAYSMANNWDWIYAGYFQLTAATVVTGITGYFVRSSDPYDPLTGPFDPDNPLFQYHSNIWSNVTGDLLPVNTGSFTGDVFSSDTTSGTFSWSDTGYDRTGSSSVQDIYRLRYALDAPLTLEAGTYWFGTNATVPEPATAVLFGLGLTGLAAAARKRRSAR